MIGKYAKPEIYLYDDTHHAAPKQIFHIYDNRFIIIVYAGICGNHEIDIQVNGENANARIIIISLVWQSQTLDLMV